ncbi:MAG: hypothetical protein M3065_14245 [Actinomycetota bacterium]|nr:hypothetical protein [Actinomycetota bacterium]
MSDLCVIEDALVPVIRQRAGRRLDDPELRLTAAMIVTALRLTLEHSTPAGPNGPRGLALGFSLRYLRDGANLWRPRSPSASAAPSWQDQPGRLESPSVAAGPSARRKPPA